MKFEKKIYTEEFDASNTCILAADIGGTNSNFGLCIQEGGYVALIASLHVKSKTITKFADVVAEVLKIFEDDFSIQLKHACFGAAGVVSEQRDWCKPTNLDFELSAQEIIKQTMLEDAVIINDFEAVGYGIEMLDDDSLVVINEGKQRAQANRAIIGAGTGLGKGILGWDYQDQLYLPVPSEGGHADFPAYNLWELEFIQFIQHSIGKATPISWEDVLSGTGIQRIYRFLGLHNNYQETAFTQQIEASNGHPDKIFSHKDQDKLCRDTFEKYAALYGRCAKNFALDTLSLGGLYIAGGIASKNLDLFTRPQFMQEFVNCGKHMNLLTTIRITIVMDYNVSLFGAATYLLQFHEK